MQSVGWFLSVRQLHLNIQIFQYTNWCARLPPGRFSLACLTTKTYGIQFVYIYIYIFKYSDGTGASDYLRGVTVLPALHMFKCRYRTFLVNKAMTVLNPLDFGVKSTWHLLQAATTLAKS